MPATPKPPGPNAARERAGESKAPVSGDVGSFAPTGPERGELDEVAFYRRLSPSSRTALAHADGMRRWNQQDRLHMEHLVLGLYQKVDGPTQRLLNAAQVDELQLRKILASAVEQRLPGPQEYSPGDLIDLPRQSAHVRAALIAARRIADERGSQKIQSRHLLYGVLSVEECNVTKALLRHVHKEAIDLADATPPAHAGPPIAGYSADVPEGLDRLEIGPEVEALCSVLVAKDVPMPVSVGLFGDWGSGKSFFMGKMSERIKLLKRAVRASGGDGEYCGNVVQIWFNAWHYMDTNLWASLAAEIFEALAMEIDRDKALAAGHGDPVQVRARLLAAAASSRDVLAEAERATTAAQEELRSSEERLKHLEQNEVETAANLRPAALAREVYRIAAQQPEIGAKMQEAARKLGLPTARAAATDLKAQLLELRGALGYVRGTWLYLRERPVARLKVLAVMALGAAVALWLPSLNLPIGTLATYVTGALVAAGGVLGPVLRHVRPAMQLLRGAREAHETAIEDARQKAKQNADAQHEQAQRKVEQAQQRVEAAAATLKEVERRLDALRVDRQLADFVRERQASSDYTKHLGIVARARRDFQQLSDLLRRVRLEGGPPAAREFGARQPEPIASIDRIVLYIDDLDRCPETKVVDVLQAVHLLLALPLFVVVVGVDPRWLVHSLKQHSKALQADIMGDSEEERLLWQSTPLNYLEKIFQIPFTLRPMGATGFANLIENLSSEHGRQAEGSTAAIVSDQVDASVVVPIETVQQALPTPSEADVRDAPSLPASTKAETVLAPPASVVPAVDAEDVDLNPRYIRLEEREREFMKHLHPLIPSPRAAKRFVNIYRLLRASAPKQRFEALIGDEEHGDYCAVQLLLAIQTGYPDQAADILLQLIERQPAEPWWTFLDSFQRSGRGTEDQSNSLEAHTWQELFERLEPLRSRIAQNESSEAFVAWAPQVARYSFQSGRALLAQRAATPG